MEAAATSQCSDEVSQFELYRDCFREAFSFCLFVLFRRQLKLNRVYYVYCAVSKIFWGNCICLFEKLIILQQTTSLSKAYFWNLRLTPKSWICSWSVTMILSKSETCPRLTASCPRHYDSQTQNVLVVWDRRKVAKSNERVTTHTHTDIINGMMIEQTKLR